jgi:toxin ParE1/3/4
VNRELIILPQANHDEDEISLYLAQNADGMTALRFLDALRDTYQDLVEMPGAGALIPDLRGSRVQGMRRWPVRGFRSYLVFYQATEDTVQIVRVLHGARDIEAILEEPS